MTWLQPDLELPRLQMFNRPSTSEHGSVMNEVHNVGPVDMEEIDFVYCKEDLVILRPGYEHA